MTALLVITPGGDDGEWFENPDAADAAVARRLTLTPEQVGALRRRITVDPIVVRRDGARWRSRNAWNVRSGDLAVQLFEMVLIDEALYDH